MIIQPAGLDGVFIVEMEQRADARGFFARSYCEVEFAAAGLIPCGRQWSVSFNHQAGTLRGMHFQADPHGETKLVRCTAGAIYDVVIDLRPGSAGYGRWIAVELSAANHRALYIPAGFAHGFQTLVDDTEVLYAITPDYVAEAARGVNHADPALGISWPLPPVAVSERDAALPLLAELS